MFLYPIYNHNWRNINTIYIHNKTSIKRNIPTIKQNTLGVGQAKDLSAPQYIIKKFFFNFYFPVLHFAVSYAQCNTAVSTFQHYLYWYVIYQCVCNSIYYFGY
jgi:hypothetical protein